MTAAREYHFEYTFGDSFKDIEVVWNDKDGNPRDLTGFSADMKVKTDDDDETELLAISTDASIGGLTINGSQGKITINVSVAQMAASQIVNEEATHKHDMELKSGDGTERKTILRGKFIVFKEVTNVT